MEESDKIQYRISELKNRIESIQHHNKKYRALEKSWHLELTQIKYDLYRLRLKLHDERAKNGNDTS